MYACVCVCAVCMYVLCVYRALCVCVCVVHAVCVCVFAEDQSTGGPIVRRL